MRNICLEMMDGRKGLNLKWGDWRNSILFGLVGFYRSTGPRCEIYSELTIKTPEWCQWLLFNVFMSIDITLTSLFCAVTVLLINKINRNFNNVCLTKYNVKFLYKNTSFLLRLVLLRIVVVKPRMFKLLFVFFVIKLCVCIKIYKLCCCYNSYLCLVLFNRIL